MPATSTCCACSRSPSTLQCSATGDDYVTSEEGFANVAAERRLGRVPVLLVRMNADLVMGEELKKTGAGNLFTVFGEPDIEIKREGDELRVVAAGRRRVRPEHRPGPQQRH